MGQGSKKKKKAAVPSQTRSEIPEEAEKVQPLPTMASSETFRNASAGDDSETEMTKIFGRKKPEAPTAPTRFGGSQYTDKPQKSKAPAMSPKRTALSARDSAMTSAQSDVDDAQSAMKAAGIIKALDGHINNL